MMADTDTWAARKLEGGDLYLRRQPGARWQVNYYERLSVTGPPLSGSFLLRARLADHHFRGRTFDSPDEAAEAVRQLVSGW